MHMYWATMYCTERGFLSIGIGPECHSNVNLTGSNSNVSKSGWKYPVFRIRWSPSLLSGGSAAHTDL